MSGLGLFLVLFLWFLLIMLTRMTSAQRLRRVILAALVGALALGSVALPARGKSLEEIERRQAAARARAAALDAQGDDLSVKVAYLDGLRTEAEKRVDQLDAELGALDRRIQQKQRELTKAQKRMAVLTIELQKILSELTARTDVFVARAVAAYKAGPTAYVEGVLSSQSFNDLVDRYEYYSAALDSDSTLIEEISALRDGVESRRTEVEVREEQIYQAKLTLQKDRVAVKVKRDERAAILAERKAIADQKASLLAQVRGKQQRWEAIEAQLQRDAAEQRAIIAAAGSSASGPLPTGGGQLLWPAAGPVTSGFGYRTHPIFGDTRFHSGIDIGAPYGAPVIASDTGTVIFAGVMSGYGNAIVVDHGNGLATSYNHLSSFFVVDGQGVARGGQIGAVGCTGYCTGPHLHFEVRVNGNPVDPMPYLQ